MKLAVISDVHGNYKALEAFLKYIEEYTLPTEKTLEFPGLPSMTICHGAPGIVRGNFELDRVLKEKVMKELDMPWLLGGHSHHQEIDVLFGKTYLNPGSLGLSIDGQGRHAQFAVLTGEDGEWQAQLVTIDYDVDSFLQDFAESGLDEYGMVLNQAVKKTLVTGENYFFECVRTVQEMTGLPLHKIPEEVWQAAGNKLGL